MKKSKNLFDFFQVQIPCIPCPACGISLQKSMLNAHLDLNCSSSTDKVNSLTKNTESLHKLSNNFLSKSNSDAIKNSKPCRSKIISKSSASSNRLSLKRQKKTASKIISLDNNLKCIRETEVITIDDDEDKDLSSCVQIAEIKDSKLVCSTTSKMSFTVSAEECKETVSYFGVSKKSLPRANCESSTVDNCCKISEVTDAVKLQQRIPSMCQLPNEEDPKICCAQASNSFTIEKTNKTIEKSMNSVKSSSTTDHNHCNYVEFFKEGKIQSCETRIPSETDFSIVDNSDVVALLTDVDKSMANEDNVFVENPGENPNSETYSPYYIANFKHILTTVMQEECNKILFNDEDLTFVNAFKSSSDAAQKLYVRLFQRKYKWLRLNKIKYPNITTDPSTILEELVKSNLVDLGLEKIDLETALDLLALPEAKMVAKQFNFNLSGKSKGDITQMLLKHCKEHKSVFFTSSKNGVSTMMLKRVKQLLGPCYRISLLPKRVFTRILMLFSLPTMSEDDDDAAGGQQQQLLTLLQVNKGEIVFPDYKINRQTPIFLDRDELIRYEEAKQLENDILNAVESRNFDLAKELYINAKEEFEDQLFCPFVERAAALPSFLKKFTSFHVYVRCMTQGVEILQKMRQYKDAVELLERLLTQKVFCQDYRGRWWDRMALNLEQHLKQRKQALEAIQEAIHDKNVRVGYRYSLLMRGLRILKTADVDDELKKEVLEAASIIEAPKVVIRGRLFPRNILGRRHVFISSSSALENEDDITVLGVEQLAIEHYKNEGFTEGIHGEGSTFHSIYGLLFWDIIYDGDIPDAFISPYQTHPLDLNHDSFFVRREKQITNHLEQLKGSSMEEIKNIAKSSWEAHFNQSSLVFWDRFTDVEHIVGLISCMSIDLLCGICERLARDFRFTRSGVPDLVVWNPNTSQVKIVEVKGPGDKLSSKQILWLDYLLKLGAQAEVCHVEAVASKKLRKE